MFEVTIRISFWGAISGSLEAIGRAFCEVLECDVAPEVPETTTELTIPAECERGDEPTCQCPTPIRSLLRGSTLRSDKRPPGARCLENFGPDLRRPAFRTIL